MYVRCYETFDEGNEFYIVTELVAGGELFDRIVAKTHYTEKEARDLVKMFLETMAYMHEAGVVHRDLKPENLLLCSGLSHYLITPISVIHFQDCQAIHLYIHKLTSPCAYASACLSVTFFLSICLSIYLCVCLCVSLSIFLCIYLSVSLSLFLSMCLSIYLRVCLSVCVSICLCLSVYVYLSVCLFVCLSVCLSK